MHLIARFSLISLIWLLSGGATANATMVQKSTADICVTHLEGSERLFRVRIMPVGSVAPDVEVESLSVHRTADGRELKAIVKPSTLNVFETGSVLTDPIYSVPLQDGSSVRPHWIDGGHQESILVYIEGGLLHVDFPASRRSSMSFTGLPSGAHDVQLVTAGNGDLMMLVLAAQGRNQVLRLRDDAVFALSLLRTREAEPTALFSLGPKMTFVAYANRARDSRRIFKIANLANPHQLLFSTALRADETLLEVHAFKPSGPLVEHIEVRTNQRSFTVEVLLDP